MRVIDRFTDAHAFLSNFSPSTVALDGADYPSVENAFQAAKTLDPAERVRFQTLSAANAKRAGRRVCLRPDWERIKVDLMRDLLRRKFAHPELRERLLATGTAQLVEGNSWRDTFWGVYNGRGQNWLGRLLMEVRDELSRH